MWWWLGFACGPAMAPALVVSTAAPARPGSAWPTEATCDEPLTAGTPAFAAWFLADGIGDPDEAAVFRLETACASRTVEVAFAEGEARLAFEAPAGAEAGVIVAVSASNASSLCTTPPAADPAAPCPTDSDTDPP